MPQTKQISSPAANSITAELFLRQVYLAEPATAVFDYDGTLWPGDAGSGFMDWSIRTGLLDPERAKWLQHRHRSYHRGEVDETAICGEMVQIYRGLSERAVRESAHLFFDVHVKPHLFPVMVDLVRELKHRGTGIWIVSSTNNWVIEEGVRAMGIAPERVLAASVATELALLTDRLIHVPSGEGKAEALRRAGLPRPDAVFGNSIHDAAMLQMARSPFAVNPNLALQQFAAERKWPMYYPPSDTFPVPEQAASPDSSV